LSKTLTDIQGSDLSRGKLLIENFLAYGLVGILGRVIPFLMLPVLTRLIKDPSIYGVFDIYSLVISFSTPICILGTYDAMFRVFFDDTDSLFRKKVCSTTFLIVSIASLSVGALLLSFSNQISILFIGSKEYSFLIRIAAVATLFSGLQSIIAAPTRMQNKRKVFIMMTLVGPIASYAVSIPLILSGRPLEGIVSGNLFALMVSLVLFCSINKAWFSTGLWDWGLAKQLLIIGLPITPCFFVYWIFNASDRLMIRLFLDVSAVGVYGIGSRLSAVSQLIYGSFAGGWQYFAFSTMKDNDQVAMISKIFHAAFLFSTLSLLILSPFMQPLFAFIAPGKYAGAYKVFPYLYICPLFLMLYQIVGQQFLNIKKAYFSTITLMGGALVNIATNAFLIPLLGVQGAALGTFIGYSAALLALLQLAKTMSLINIGPYFFVLFLTIAASFLSYNFAAFFLRSIASLALLFLVLAYDWEFAKGLFRSGLGLTRAWVKG
jgi:O-antigen/teichoic acid export membrane protein